MSELKLQSNVTILKVNQLWSNSITVSISDLRGLLLGVTALNKEQAKELKDWLKEAIK